MGVYIGRLQLREPHKVCRVIMSRYFGRVQCRDATINLCFSETERKGDDETAQDTAVPAMI